MLQVKYAVVLTDRAHLTQVRASNCGRLGIACELTAGTWRFEALLDASRINWERFYQPMTRYNNCGQRTGIWDFDMHDNNRPLLPAWWVWLDGRRLGIVLCSRVSPGEISTRRLSLEFCFEVNAKSSVLLELEPYNDFDLPALHLQLAPEPDDRRQPLLSTRPRGELSFAAWQSTKGELRRWREKLARMPQYGQLLDKAVSWAKASESSEALPVLAFAHRELNDGGAGRLLAERIGRLVAIPHWGNPDPAGYQHDGDMFVAGILEPLSFVYHWSKELLERFDLRELLKQKLKLQMGRFYRGILLTSAYWGGSILQDHGHRSVSRFSVSAINLLGVLPEARHWLEFGAARLRRVLQALPSDGGVPGSSYHKVHLYLDDMTVYRDALAHVTGEDLFDEPVFLRTIDFVINRLDETDNKLVCVNPRGDRKDFYAGWGFFNAIASKYRHPGAARLTQILIDKYAVESMHQRPAATLLNALSHADLTVTPRPLRPSEFDYRPDSGLVNYRPQGGSVQVSVKCGAPNSLNAYFASRSACDRAIFAPIEGHFVVSIAGQCLLLTAEGGYRMRASLGSVMLVDGKGPWGDLDYAMGTPGVTYRGERIESVWHDPDTHRAFIRMDLTPAYPREANLLRYRRELHLEENRLLCRDIVVATGEKAFSWHFHTYARRDITKSSANSYRISEAGRQLELAGDAEGIALSSHVGNAEVVWAYQNENDDQQFRQIVYETQDRVANTVIDFTIRWPASVSTL